MISDKTTVTIIFVEKTAAYIKINLIYVCVCTNWHYKLWFNVNQRLPSIRL